MEERRKLHRQRSFLGGRIATGGHTSTLDCVVRDISQHGARLTFEHLVLLPSEFDLVIETRSVNRRARVLWQRSQSAGIVFEPAADQEAAQNDLIRELARSRKQRAALRRRVAQLSG